MEEGVNGRDGARDLSFRRGDTKWSWAGRETADHTGGREELTGSRHISLIEDAITIDVCLIQWLGGPFGGTNPSVKFS